MKTILFATGNSRKISEANTTLAPYEIKVEPVHININEIQHLDSTEIAKAKAVSAYREVERPVVVSDTSWEIPALGGFPSGYMKDISYWWTTDNWLDIIKKQQDKRIFCLEHVAYFDGQELKHFVERYEGRFIDEPRGRIDEAESFERIVILYGEETMAEQLARGENASAGETLGHWERMGAWLQAQST